MFIDSRERERMREREKYMDMRAIGMCPDQRLNPQTFGVWDDAPTI